MDHPPKSIAKHYSLNPPQNAGSKQKIGIINLYGTVPNEDLIALSNKLGLMPSSKNVIKWKITGGGRTSKTQKPSVDEVFLDMAIIGYLCPYADITVYQVPLAENYANADLVSGFADAIDAAVKDGCKVISCSFEKSESELNLIDFSHFNDIMSNAVSQSVTVLAATGDYGSADVQGSLNASIGFPSSHPNILAVGGTQLNSNGLEEAWTNGGGGISQLFKTPPYQALPHFPKQINGWKPETAGPSEDYKSLPPQKTPKSLTNRVVPDVAALAKNWDMSHLLKGYGSNSWDSISGTSASTPFWASIIAWCNQKAGPAHPISNLHMKLYSYMLSAAKASTPLTNDITMGNNSGMGYALYFKATKGFDACTGWGTPNQNILDSLASWNVAHEIEVNS